MEKGCLRNALPEKSLRLLLVVLSTAGLALAQSQSQAASPSQTTPQSQPEQKQESLADAARKAKAKKAKSEPGKVYTDEDLSGHGHAGISVVGQEGAAADASQEAKNAGRGEAATGKNEEAIWRAKAQKIRDQMNTLDEQIAKLKDDIKKNGAAGFDASSGLQKNVIYVNDKNARLLRMEQKRAELDKEMDQLQEEGRKAGASPSWFR